MKSTQLQMSLLVMILGFVPVKSFSQDSIRLVNFERSAEYPEGQKALFKFIADNLNITKSTDETCQDGVVYANFCVNVDGSLSDIKIKKGLCAAHNAAVKRVLLMMPKWKSAIEYGSKKPAKSYVTLPICVRVA